MQFYLHEPDSYPMMAFQNQLWTKIVFAMYCPYILFCCSGYSFGDEQEKVTPEPTLEEVKQWIDDLGSDDFETRESAVSLLEKGGAFAEKELRKHRRNPDPQVRRAVNSILIELITSNREKHLQSILEKESLPTELPEWERFKRLVGDTAKTREFYYEMAKHEWELLQVSANKPKLLDYTLYKRASNLRPNTGGRRYPVLGSLAALYFIASNPQADISTPSLSELQNYFSSPEFVKTIQNEQTSEPLRTVVEQLFSTVVDNPNMTHRNQYLYLLLAIRENIKAGKDLAKNLLEDSNPLDAEATRSNIYLSYAMLAFAKLGSKADTAYLEKYLEDKKEIINYTPDASFTTQLRDVALLAILHLHDKDPKQFGFERLSEHKQYLYNYRSIGFASPVDRAKAFEKFKVEIKKSISTSK